MSDCKLPTVEKLDEKIAAVTLELKKLKAFRKALAENGPDVLEGTMDEEPK